MSDKQQKVSALHIHVSILLQTPLPSRLPHNTEQSPICCTIGPCRLSILNIAECACPSQLPNYPLSPSFPLVTISLFSKPVSLLLFCQLICIISLQIPPIRNVIGYFFFSAWWSRFFLIQQKRNGQGILLWSDLVRTVLEDLSGRRGRSWSPPQHCPWFFFPLSTFTLIPLPFVSVSFCTHGLLIRPLALSPLCVFSTLQILLSHHFSLSWPFLVQGNVVASFLLQIQVPDLCLVLSPFPSSNAPGERRSHSLAGPCLPRGWSGIGCVLSQSLPLVQPARTGKTWYKPRPPGQNPSADDVSVFICLFFFLSFQKGLKGRYHDVHNIIGFLEDQSWPCMWKVTVLTGFFQKQALRQGPKCE